MRLVTVPAFLVLAAVLCTGIGCSGGCPLDPELVSLTPQVDCLDVKGGA